jgi:hypothetical protein
MAPVNHIADDPFALDDFEEELRRLSAVNQELLGGFQHQDEECPVATLAPPISADFEELERVRQENAELRLRVEELESLGAGKGEELWLERQREYETLLEEKSDVIRGLHQKLQEAEESAIGGPAPLTASSVNMSATKLGQAEEILRLKREMEAQRQQLAQDEDDMMAQMRQMEMTMAKERAEMARQRQEVQRLQAGLAREIENANRDPDLRDRLQNLRRSKS